MPKPKRVNLGFSVAKVTAMTRAEDRYYEWGRAIEYEVKKFMDRSERRFEKYGRNAKDWYKREAAARQRLILRLAAMLEEMETREMVFGKRRTRKPPAQTGGRKL